ncbi:ImmA/IrrE family metallo-endopeptidase [Streptomyces sp. NEAU-174]|uniref:ImmA/IrrE family metallo-endopeptidase n=1 Tax=Streptomyces sp. NEAU-174 TaxID=3458254 RepID=UPI004044EA8A
MSYEPTKICRELGIRVEWMRLRDTWGAWVPNRRLIILATELSPALERCVLAHQVEHALVHDSAGCGIGPYADSIRHRFTSLTIRQERRADREAARKLIPDSHVAAVARWARGNIRVAAGKLGVTEGMLRIRLDDTGEAWPWPQETSRIAG